MDKQQIIAGNEAIAKFMGATRHEHNEGRPYATWILPGDLSHYHPNHLRYHERWDWLLPVVKKVNNTHIFSDKIIIYKPALMNALMENDINEAWNIVTQFIKLCNENPHQHGT